MEELLTRITVNSEVLAGKPVIRGMRISVEQVLIMLAAGLNIQEILAEYPFLEEDDIKAAILYAVKLVKEEQVFEVVA